MHAEKSLSIVNHNAVSNTINLRKQRMTPFQIYGAEIMPIIPL